MVSDKLRVLKDVICNKAYVRCSDQGQCPGLHWKHECCIARAARAQLGTHGKSDQILEIECRREECRRNLKALEKSIAPALAVEEWYLSIVGWQAYPDLVNMAGQRRRRQLDVADPMSTAKYLGTLLRPTYIQSHAASSLS